MAKRKKTKQWSTKQCTEK